VITKTIVQNVPAKVPAGTYGFNFNAGRYATNPLAQHIIATDNFTFTKSASPTTKIGAGAETVNDWNSNWNDEIISAVSENC